mmetsp:Transcript_42766/g.48257  ORF Transcript_42766/g.48257 Transcript_42766/m.48257 type:complete len:112 (+) Transcript_42766:729-1064(+)
MTTTTTIPIATTTTTLPQIAQRNGLDVTDAQENRPHTRGCRCRCRCQCTRLFRYVSEVRSVEHNCGVLLSMCVPLIQVCWMLGLDVLLAVLLSPTPLLFFTFERGPMIQFN